MSAERLREMLSEATPGWKWRGDSDVPAMRLTVDTSRNGRTIFAGTEADARLAALAPDAIALLADMDDQLRLENEKHPNHNITKLRQRLDALCGDERA